MLRTLLNHTAIRYVISGGVAAGVGLLSIFVLVEVFHLWYIAATTISFVLTLITSFTLQRFWTFDDAANNALTAQFGGYLAVSFVNIFVNAGLMYLFVDILALHYLLAQTLVMLIISVYGFSLYRYLVFKPQSAQQTD